MTQTRGYVDDKNRGNCMAACLASVFELPITAVPRKDHSTKLHAWLAKRYPGVHAVKRDYQEPHPSWPFEYVPVFHDEAPWHFGYWIAGVESPRFKTTCVRCWSKGEITVYLENDYEEGKPDDERNKIQAECFVCEGSGQQQGLHAVVMRGAEMVWDPSPERAMGIGRFHSETTFVVSHPEKLARHA